jgi:hypothetical protein
MVIEAQLLPRNLSSVSMRTFVIPFYYGSGSVKAKNYGLTAPVLVPQHCSKPSNVPQVHSQQQYSLHAGGVSLTSRVQTGAPGTEGLP